MPHRPHERPAATRPPPALRAAEFVALAAAYAALAMLGLRWATVNGAASPVWPAAGVALAGLFLWGVRLWPAVLAGAFIGFLLTDSAHPWWLELLLAAGNALAAALAAAGLRRVGFSAALGRAKDALALIGIGAIGSAAVAATLGTAALWAFGPLGSAHAAWLTWCNGFFGDAVGVLIGAALLLPWGATPLPRSARWWVHHAACLAACVVVGWAVFLADTAVLPIAWYAFAPLLWAAFAFGARATVALALMAGLAVWGTAAGTGPFAPHDLGPWQYLLLQQFIAMAAVTTLIVATLANERQAGEALQAAEEQLRMALSAGKMGVWSWNPVTDRATWDAGMERLTGLSVHPWNEHNAIEFLAHIHPDDRPQVQAQALQTFQKGGQYDHELCFHRPDGRTVWLACFAKAVRNAEGRITHLTGVSFDVTERKRAEEALRASEQRSRQQLQELDTLYQTAPIGMWLGDGEGRFLRVNEVLAKVHGQPVQAHIGKTFREIVPGLADAVEPRYRHVLQTGEPVLGFEVVGRAPGDPQTERTWVVSFYPLLGEQPGEVIAVSCIMQDVTKHKRVTAALREADRRKDEYLATLAHELRNPLAPVRTGLQLLRKAPAGSPAAASARDMMERQVQHMVRLIDDLLDVSRITRGKVELRRERVSLAQVVDIAIEASRPHLEAGGHQFTVCRPPEPIFVDADAARLTQVVSNLLNNAAKYTPEGGCIELTIEREDHDAVIRVTDTGVGIAHDALPRVFEMFTQVGRTLDRSQGGLGIGLSLVKRLVELHGGTVQAASAGPGCGSTFVVRLPLAAMRQSDFDQAGGPEVVCDEASRAAA